MSDKHPEEGEVWFVKYPHLPEDLDEVRVIDLTPRTIAIEAHESESVKRNFGARRARYKRGDIEFVERKSAAPSAPAHVGEAWPKPEK